MTAVLIVEDNLLLCKMEQRQISSAFPDVYLRAVHNGNDALKAAMELQPDAVVMDCKLPGCGCMDLLDGILEISPGAAIIIASADPPRDLKQKRYRSKIFEILEKPFEAEELINVLKKAFAFKDGEILQSVLPTLEEKALPIQHEGSVPFDRHEMVNILSGIYVGIRAFEADLTAGAENLPAIRETIAEYVPKLLKMVERATAQIKQVEK